MFHHRFVSCSAASVIALAVASPVVAQDMTPSLAWAQLQGMAAGAGLTVTARSTVDQGSALEISGVRIFPTRHPDDLTVSMETLRVEQRGAMTALIPSELVSVDTRFAGGITRSFAVHHTGEIVGALTETDAALDLNFGSLTAQLLHAERDGTPMNEHMSLSLDGFAATMRAAREGAAEIIIDAQTISYALDMSDTRGKTVVRQSASGEVTRPHLDFAATELDMMSDEPGALRTAFEAGMSARLNIGMEGSQGASDQQIDGTHIALTSTGAGSSMSFNLVDGRFDGELRAGPVRIDVSQPAAGTVTADGASLNVGLPLIVTPDDQPMRYAFSFDNVMPSPGLLELIGAGQFGGDSVSLALDLGADGRVTRELGPDSADGDTPPFDISALRLDNLMVRVGDSEFTGTGAVALIGGLMAQIGRPMPNANGDLTFNLIGGERLLTRLTAMGVVPNDQLFFVRMMMNGLGRSVGEDHLVSEVAIRPGGAITVNGAPLPF